MEYNVKVGIVLVSYHNADMTLRFIQEELLKLSVPYTLVVVNNDSTLEECQELADKAGLCLVAPGKPILASNRYILCSRENLGYARGNNLGVEFLREIGVYSHYLFTNDDVELKDHELVERLVATMAGHTDVACIGPRVLGLDGRDQSPHHSYISPMRQIGWKLFSFLRRHKKGHTAVGDSPDRGYTYWVSGAFMLCKAEAFHQVGGFDPATFLYFEEVILSERLKSIQARVYFEPSVTVLHYEGNSTASTASKTKQRIEMDSRLYYYRTYMHESSIVLWLYKFICSKE